MYEDNETCINLIKGTANVKRTKHIDVKIQFLQDLISKGKLKLEYCRSVNQLADVFTKSLSVEPFNKFRSNLGILEI